MGNLFLFIFYLLFYQQSSTKSPRKPQGAQNKNVKQPKPCYHCAGPLNSQRCPFSKNAVITVG